MMQNQNVLRLKQAKSDAISMIMSSVENKIKFVNDNLQALGQAIMNWQNFKNQLASINNSNDQDKEYLKERYNAVVNILNRIIDDKNMILWGLYILKQNGSDCLNDWFNSTGLSGTIKQIVEKIKNLNIDGNKFSEKYGEEYKAELENFFTNIQHINSISLEYVNTIAMSKSNYEKGEFDPGKMPIGLQNIGSTCYMDASLQMFYNISGLREYFEHGPLKDKYNKRVYNLVKYYHDNINDLFKVTETEYGVVKVNEFKKTINYLWSKVCSVVQSNQNVEIKLNTDDMSLLEEFCINRMEHIGSHLHTEPGKVKKKVLHPQGGFVYVDTEKDGFFESLSDEQKKELRLMSYCFVDDKCQVKADNYGHENKSYYSFVENHQNYTFAEMLTRKIKAREEGTKSTDKEVYEEVDIYDIAYELCLLIKNLNKAQNEAQNDYAPKRFKESLSISNPLFKGDQANDSKDLILFLMECMHKELNMAKKPGAQKAYNNASVNNANSNTYNFLEVFNNFTKLFAENHRSWISSKFYGTHDSMLECQNCKMMTHNVQLDNILIFPLNEVRKFKNYPAVGENGTKVPPTVTLKECFEYYSKLELIDGQNSAYCNYCSKKNNGVCMPAVTVTQLLTLPDELVINLNRGKGLEFDVKIDFPEYLDHFDLNLENPPNGNQSQKFIFKKWSSEVTHFGESSMDGHFINIGKNAKNGLIYRFNDSLVTLDSFQGAKSTGTPYVLKYATMSPEDMLDDLLKKVKNPIYSKSIIDRFNSFTNFHQKQSFAYLLMSAAVGRDDLEAADNLSDLICAVYDVIKCENNFQYTYMHNCKALINKMAMWVNCLQKAESCWNSNCNAYTQINQNRQLLQTNYTMDALIYETSNHVSPQNPLITIHYATILLNHNLRYKVNLRDIINRIRLDNNWNILCEEDVFANSLQQQKNQMNNFNNNQNNFNNNNNQNNFNQKNINNQNNFNNNQQMQNYNNNQNNPMQNNKKMNKNNKTNINKTNNNIQNNNDTINNQNQDINKTNNNNNNSIKNEQKKIDKGAEKKKEKEVQLKKEKERKALEDKERKDKERKYKEAQEVKKGKEKKNETTTNDNKDSIKNRQKKNDDKKDKEEGNKTTTNINEANKQEQHKLKEEKQAQEKGQNNPIDIDNIVNKVVDNSKPSTFAAFCNELADKQGGNVDLSKLNFGPVKLGFWNCFRAFFLALFDGVYVNCGFWNRMCLRVFFENAKSKGASYCFKATASEGSNNQSLNHNEAQYKKNIKCLSKLISEAEEKTKKNQVPAKNSEDKNQIDK